MIANIRVVSVVLVAAVMSLAAPLHAQTNPAAVFEAQNCDPCVPEGVRKKALAAVPMLSKSLPEAVTQRLKARFDAADVNRAGALTRAQAEAGGFGFIALNFDAMDRRNVGAVTFEDVTVFLRSRGAKLD